MAQGPAEEYCEPPVSPKPPTSPAFAFPLDRLANQCKCRRRPGPQLAFQRAQTTSRALNKCRCDRRETPGGAPLRPHLPPGAGRRALSRAWAVRARRPRPMRGVLSGRMGCSPIIAEGRKPPPPRLRAARGWCEPHRL